MDKQRVARELLKLAKELVSKSPKFKKGQKVEFDYNGKELMGYIAVINEDSNGQYVYGINAKGAGSKNYATVDESKIKKF